MFLSGMPYFFFQSSALDGVPVTMPASRQLRVFSSAGAIWLVARLPSPHQRDAELACRRLAERLAGDAGEQRRGGERGGLGEELAARVLAHDVHPCGRLLTIRRESLAECAGGVFCAARNRVPGAGYPCQSRNGSGEYRHVCPIQLT